MDDRRLLDIIGDLSHMMSDDVKFIKYFYFVGPSKIFIELCDANKKYLIVVYNFWTILGSETSWCCDGSDQPSKEYKYNCDYKIPDDELQPVNIGW